MSSPAPESPSRAASMESSPVESSPVRRRPVPARAAKLRAAAAMPTVVFDDDDDDHQVRRDPSDSDSSGPRSDPPYKEDSDQEESEDEEEDPPSAGVNVPRASASPAPEPSEEEEGSSDEEGSGTRKKRTKSGKKGDGTKQAYRIKPGPKFAQQSHLVIGSGEVETQQEPCVLGFGQIPAPVVPPPKTEDAERMFRFFELSVAAKATLQSQQAKIESLQHRACLEVESNLLLERMLRKQNIAVPDIPLTRRGFTRGPMQQKLEALKFGITKDGVAPPLRTVSGRVIASNPPPSTVPPKTPVAPLMPSKHPRLLDTTRPVEQPGRRRTSSISSYGPYPQTPQEPSPNHQQSWPMGKSSSYTPPGGIYHPDAWPAPPFTRQPSARSATPYDDHPFPHHRAVSDSAAYGQRQAPSPSDRPHHQPVNGSDGAWSAGAYGQARGGGPPARGGLRFEARGLGRGRGGPPGRHHGGSGGYRVDGGYMDDGGYREDDEYGGDWGGYGGYDREEGRYGPQRGYADNLPGPSSAAESSTSARDRGQQRPRSYNPQYPSPLSRQGELPPVGEAPPS